MGRKVTRREPGKANSAHPAPEVDGSRRASGDSRRWRRASKGPAPARTPRLRPSSSRGPPSKQLKQGDSRIDGVAPGTDGEMALDRQAGGQVKRPINEGPELFGSGTGIPRGARALWQHQDEEAVHCRLLQLAAFVLRELAFSHPCNASHLGLVVASQ